MQSMSLFLGAYVPLTIEGNIVVDGILASCYAYADHDLGHLGMMPFRWLPDRVDIWCRQWVSSLCRDFSRLG